MPVVSPAHDTDAVAHSWSGKQAMREEKILTRFCSPAPLFANPCTEQTHSFPIYPSYSVQTTMFFLTRFF